MGDGIAEGGKNLLSIPFYPTERSSNFILLTDKNILTMYHLYLSIYSNSYQL